MEGSRDLSDESQSRGMTLSGAYLASPDPEEEQVALPETGVAGIPSIAAMSSEPNVASSGIFESPPPSRPPLRSIFSSGPPTASLSSSTAHASMSAIPSFRPLAALSIAGSSRRPLNIPRHLDLASPAPTVGQSQHKFSVPEKDVDDPTASVSAGAREQANTMDAALSPQPNLSRLFVASDGTSPSISRGASHLRSISGTGVVFSSDTTTLSGHLFHRGFMDGRHSDITVRAFGQEYKLHKLILDRVPFFASAFSGAWAESSAKEMTLHPADVDSNITRVAFEHALRRIYGGQPNHQEEQDAIGLFATACWLDMTDLVDSSVDCLLRQMHPSKLDVLIKLVTNNYYGKAGDRILSSAKAMLCREGWEMPYQYWDSIPAEIIREVIGGDPFYVSGEWERWFLTLKLLNRRLKAKAVEAGLVSPNGAYNYPKPSTLKFFAVRFDATYRRDSGLARGQYLTEKDDAWVSLYTSPEITPLLVLLDEGIHYVHLRFEQLQQIRTQKDILGVPVLPEKVISDALWMSMELRQRVVNAQENDLELGLSEVAEDYEDELQAVEAARTESGKGKQREPAQEENNDLESGSWDGNGKPRKFWIPGNDISCVMGGSREAYLASNPISSPEWATHTSRLSASLEPSDVTWASDFTGSAADMSGPIPRNIVSPTAPRFSHFPPFRFSAEFPNPRTLKEKKRVYSQTVWYAGSMWNLYIQRVNTSKNQQLGIYLHRAKDKDPSEDPLAQLIPTTVDDRIGQLEREMLLRKNERRNRFWASEVIASGADADREYESSESGPEYEGPALSEGLESSNRIQSSLRKGRKSASQIQKPSSTPETASLNQDPWNFSQLLISDDEIDDLRQSDRRYNISALPPYTDGRPTIKTYFKIYSPSKAGRLLSIYESAPDQFNFSQSWGWKSSQMVLDDGLGGYEGSKGAKDGKLRYMVVIGNV